jgi:hypothetical protein
MTRTIIAAVVLIETDDPALCGHGTVAQQWTALNEAVAGGGVVKVVACMSERDAGAMLYAFDQTKKLIGEPLAAAPSGHSPRRH